MNYRVEYNGGDLEVTTLDAAMDNAKNAIAADLGPISGWTVEHDESINDWFIQGVLNGEPVGPTAVITGPDPMVASVAAPSHPARDTDGWLQRVSFSGQTVAEAFGAATSWLNSRASVITVTDVSWSEGRLRLYFTERS